MSLSDSDCSSYQSGDPRKYEIDYTNEDDKKEADLDFYIDTLMEVSSPSSNADQFYATIKDFRREKKELVRTIWDKNRQLNDAELTEEVLRTRIGELESEVQKVKQEKASQNAPKPSG